MISFWAYYKSSDIVAAWLTVVRQRLWQLTGILGALAAIDGQTSGLGQTSSPRQLSDLRTVQNQRPEPATRNAVMNLTRTMGQTLNDTVDGSEQDICPICTVSMMLTSLPCNHQ